MRCGGVTVFPLDKVRKRLMAGAEHNLRDYYQVFREQMSAGTSPDAEPGAAADGGA